MLTRGTQTESPRRRKTLLAILSAVIVATVVVLSGLGYVLLQNSGPQSLPRSLASVTISGPSGPMTVGDSRAFTALALDEQGKELPEATFAWSLTHARGVVSSPSGNATTFTASSAGTETLRVDAAYVGVTRQANRSFAIEPVLRATTFALQVPASVVQGKYFGATLTVRDQSGAVFTRYRGTVRLESNDTAATLPGDYTFLTADAGIHTFAALRLGSEGLYFLSAIDVADPALSARVSILVTANRPPVITVVAVNREDAEVDLPLTFTAIAVDPDGDPLTYDWDFGDANTAPGTTVSHGYALPGRYVAVVTVSDGAGHSVDSDDRPLFVLVLPPEILPPAPPGWTGPAAAVLAGNRTVVRQGETVRFAGNASWAYVWNGVGAYLIRAAADYPLLFRNLTYHWGDGSPDTIGVSSQVGVSQHSFDVSGSSLVTLTVVVVGASGPVAASSGYTVRVQASVPPITKTPSVFIDAGIVEPRSLDPAVDYEDMGWHVIGNVAETLIGYDRERADVYVPVLATRVPDLGNPAEVSPDRRTYNFTLRPGVQFHAGGTVDCHAVEFSIERVLLLNDPDGPEWTLDQSLTNFTVDDPATPSTNERVVAIQRSVACPDGPSGLSVQFRLAAEHASFLATLAMPVASIIDPNPAAYTATARCPSTNLSASACNDQIVGTGPFILRQWSPYQRISLERNDAFRGTPSSFRTTHLLTVRDVTTRAFMIAAGDADRIDLPQNRRADIRSPSGGLLPGVNELVGDTFLVYFLGFNQNINLTGVPVSDMNVTSDFFRDIHVRKAFSYAWKYDTYIQNVLGGIGRTLCGPIPAGMWGYLVTEPCYATDLTYAHAEFQRALDPRTANPLDTYWDNGFTITIYFNLGNLAREEAGRLLSSTLALLNPKFIVKVQGLDWAAFLDTIRSGKSAMLFLGWAPDYADPDDYVVPILRSGGFFTSRIAYSNASLDALLDRQAFERDPLTRLDLLRQIQLSAYADVPYLWQVQTQALHVYRAWVVGYYTNPILSCPPYAALSK